jgi:hypothetical protein
MFVPLIQSIRFLMVIVFEKKLEPRIIDFIG